MIAIYRSRNKKNRKLVNRILIAALILIGLLLIRNYAGRPLENFTLRIGGPVAKAYLGVKERVVLTMSFTQSRQHLSAVNRELREEVRGLESELVRLRSLEREYQSLLSQYYRPDSSHNSILANVISKPPQSFYDIIIVDAGFSNGVKIGDLAYGQGGLPVGTVSEVTGYFAKIVAFSSPGQLVQSTLERTGASLELVGSGGGNLESRVSQDFDIVPGDLAVLPGFGGRVVGEVVSVDSRVTSAFKQVYLRLPINIFNLRWLEIVEAPNPNDENGF